MQAGKSRYRLACWIKKEEEEEEVNRNVIRAPIVNTFLPFYFGSYLFYERGQQLNVSLSETSVHIHTLRTKMVCNKEIFFIEKGLPLLMPMLLPPPMLPLLLHLLAK